VDKVQGDYQAQGFVGLGPEGLVEGLSLPLSLFYDKKMIGMKVGLNYENPINDDRVSTITFGYFDLGHVEKGQAGLVGFKNIGTDNWSIQLMKIKYDG